jgi:hypothetical protein
MYNTFALDGHQNMIGWVMAMPNCLGFTGKYMPGMARVISFAKQSRLVTKCTIEVPKTRSGKHTDWRTGIKLVEGTYLQTRCKDNILVVTVTYKNEYQTARIHTTDASELKRLLHKSV